MDQHRKVGNRSRGFSVIDKGNGNSTPYNLYKLLLKELGIDLKSNSGVKDNEDATKPVLISSKESLEQIMNMIKLPFYLERFMVFSLLTCLNSFLKLLVILPLKLLIDVSILLVAFRDQFLVRNQITGESRIRKYLSIVKLKNIIFTSMIILTIYFANVDTSKIYHKIRIQSSIKLYVMFGVLGISDKLLSTVGQDLLNYIFSFNASKITNIRSLAQFLLCYVLSVIYLSTHTVILIYQTVALNVAVNSYSNSLVTLLLSSQFAEIKGAVFKKLDREGLFQMSCADVVERFQLLTMLAIISLRNLVQISNDPENFGLLPNASYANWNRVVGLVLGPTAIVIGSELLVDWVKHAYVTKFNKIRPKIYSKYLNILSTDVIDNFRYQVSNNNEDKIQQRLGIPLPALFVLFIVMSKHILYWFLFDEDGELIFTNVSILVVSFATLLSLKLLLELALLKWSNHILRKYVASVKQPTNPQDYYVPGLLSGGDGAIDADTRKYLYEKDEKIPPTLNETRDSKDLKSNLNDVTRYQMFSKRIW